MICPRFFNKASCKFFEVQGQIHSNTDLDALDRFVFRMNPRDNVINIPSRIRSPWRSDLTASDAIMRDIGYSTQTIKELNYLEPHPQIHQLFDAFYSNRYIYHDFRNGTERYMGLGISSIVVIINPRYFNIAPGTFPCGLYSHEIFGYIYGLDCYQRKPFRIYEIDVHSRLMGYRYSGTSIRNDGEREYTSNWMDASRYMMLGVDLAKPHITGKEFYKDFFVVNSSDTDYIGRQACIKDIPIGYDYEKFLKQLSDKRNTKSKINKRAKK